MPKYKKGYKYFGGGVAASHTLKAAKIQAAWKKYKKRQQEREQQHQLQVGLYRQRHPEIATYHGPRPRPMAAGSGLPLPYSNIHVTAQNPLPGHPNMRLPRGRARNIGMANWWSEL